ncbi:hypothetical protein QN239_02645 [Mycolicibacterium sp. Y3]
MTDSVSDFMIGQRVLVYPGTSEERGGTVVEDFGDSAGVAVTIGEDLIVAPSRRWAITLDDGVLVFLDSVDLASA